jgi:hypothetical protein
VSSRPSVARCDWPTGLGAEVPILLADTFVRTIGLIGAVTGMGALVACATPRQANRTVATPAMESSRPAFTCTSTGAPTGRDKVGASSLNRRCPGGRPRGPAGARAVLRSDDVGLGMVWAVRFGCYKRCMPALVELVTGTWLDGLPDDVGHEAVTLTRLLTQGVMDAVLALAMFEQVVQAQSHPSHASWERDRALEQAREEELAAQDPWAFGAPGYIEWRTRLSEQARRDVLRQKWADGELPNELAHRLPFLHAQTFVTTLAQVGRTLEQLAKLATGSAATELRAARGDYEKSLPGLKAVRDSVEHAEDRMRGRDRSGKTMTLAPVTNAAIHAPGGGVLIGGMLSNNSFGWTVDDGSYQEVEISDATVEAARAAVQRALNALPWKHHGFPRHVPSR